MLEIAAPPLNQPETATFWHDHKLGLDLTRAHVRAHRFKRHSHQTFVVLVTEAGILRGVIGGVEYLLRAGSVLILHPEQAHWGEDPTACGWTFRAFYPEASVIASLLYDLTGKRCEVPDFPTVIEDANTSDQLLNAHHIIEHGDANSRQSAYCFALNTLVGRARQFKLYDKSTQLSPGRIKLVRDYIHAHYDESINVKTLAGVANCGTFQLIRAFERQMGVPIHTYVTHVRLHYACTLLADGQSGTEVAAAVGFSDQSHLIRRFRQAYGVTPGSYIRDSH